MTLQNPNCYFGLTSFNRFGDGDTLIRFFPLVIPSVGENGSLPNDFSLSQNYPNPFNPVTKIGYGVSSSGFVSLKLYDVLGQEVATLVNAIEEPGYKSVTWNGKEVPSGVYFYRLQAGSFIETKKLLLLR
jgi:hypothetical protein